MPAILNPVKLHNADESVICALQRASFSPGVSDKVKKAFDCYTANSLLTQTGLDHKVTLMGFAVWRGNRELARFLIKQGAKIDVPVAALLGRHRELVRLLQANPKILNQRFPHVWDKRLVELNLASATVRLLTEHGAVFDVPNLALHGLTDRVLERIKCDASLLNTPGGHNEFTPIDQALVGKHYDLVRMFIQMGAEVNYLPKGRHVTLLIRAVEAPADIVAMLLQNGGGQHIEYSAEGAEGWTALNLTILKNRERNARLLLKAGANPNIFIKWEKCTALALAHKNNHPRLAKLLCQYGAKM